MHRVLGAKRPRGSREGMTQMQAEEKLRRLMAEEAPSSALGDRLTLSEAGLREAGLRYRGHLSTQELKRSTVTAVESVFRVWLDPQLGDQALDAITTEDLEDLMRSMAAAGVGSKSIRNYVGTLSALFRFAMSKKRRWATANPCEDIELPKRKRAESREILFLSVLEVETLISAAVPGLTRRSTQRSTPPQR